MVCLCKDLHFLNGCEKHLLSITFPPLGIAKLEEGRLTGSVTGNDITAPPNKELPPSPEKKTKVGARMVGCLLLYFFKTIFCLLLLESCK